MLEKIASQLTLYMMNKGVVPPEDEEIYIYGWSLLLSTLGSFFAMLLLGTVLGQLPGTVLFILFFVFLRSYAGGYHAASYGSCFLLTMTLYSTALLFHFYLPESYIDWMLVILLLISVFITYRWAPVDHPNKPLNAEEKQKNKKMSRGIVLLQSAVLLVLWLWQPWLKQYLLWAAVGMAVTSFTLLYVIFYPYQEGGEKNENA